MIINLSPVRMEETLTLDREGDRLYLNGELFDFGPLPDGATLPAVAISSDWFAGEVSRIGGQLHLALRLPHGPNAPESTRFPIPITVKNDGPVELPIYDVIPEFETLEVIQDE